MTCLNTSLFIFLPSKQYSFYVKGMLQAVWPCQLKLDYAKVNNVLDTIYPQSHWSKLSFKTTLSALCYDAHLKMLTSMQVNPEDFLQWHCHSAERLLSATSQNPWEHKSFLPLYPFTDLPGTVTIGPLWACLSSPWFCWYGPRAECVVPS